MKRNIRRELGLLVFLLLGCLWLLPIGKLHAETTCTQFGVVSSSNARLKYQNNFYNPSSGSQQCLYVTDAENGGFYITNDAIVPATGAPSAYPSVFMGCQWGNCSNPAFSQLPAQLSDLGLAHSSWSVAPTPSGAWDISYDIWFNQTPSTSGQPDGTEVMIWLDDHGGIRPAGSLVDNVTIDGINFDVYVAPKNSQGFNAIWNVVSYRATTALHAVDFSLMPFFDDAVSRGQLQRSWWLIAVEAGFESWSGANGLASSDFSFSLYKYSQLPRIGWNDSVTPIELPATRAAATPASAGYYRLSPFPSPRDRPQRGLSAPMSSPGQGAVRTPLRLSNRL